MKMRNRIALIAVVLLFLVLVRFVSEIGHEPGPFFVVTRIIDGDTVELNGRERLRLFGIDTPEEGEPFYDSATAFLNRRLLDKQVELVYSERRRDPYGRLLAYVYIDTFFINAEIIRGGYAHVYLFPDNLADTLRTMRLIEAQRVALTDNLGIWKIPPLVVEDYYIGNVNSRRFHRPGCGSASRMRPGSMVEFGSRLEAFRAGYSPCRNCKP